MFTLFQFFIGPESDHWQCLSLTNWLTDSLTDCCLLNLFDVTLACEDANSKLIEVVNVDDEDRVGNNLLQRWELRFGHKAKLLFRLLTFDFWDNLFLFFLLFNLRWAQLYVSLVAHTYCLIGKVKTLSESRLMNFWAKCGVDGVGDG